ncbi:hypothetical protein GCM10027446_30290 [Angustibacter peucedani]
MFLGAPKQSNAESDSRPTTEDMIGVARLPQDPVARARREAELTREREERMQAWIEEQLSHAPRFTDTQFEVIDRLLGSVGSNRAPVVAPGSGAGGERSHSPGPPPVESALTASPSGKTRPVVPGVADQASLEQFATWLGLRLVYLLVDQDGSS